MEDSDTSSQQQFTLIQNGEFIVCDEITYKASPPVLLATSAVPVNTMKPVSIRLGNEILRLTSLRSQGTKVLTNKIRIDGDMARRVAEIHALS